MRTRGNSHHKTDGACYDLVMTDADREELIEAKRLLENPRLVAKISNVVGTPIEVALNRLPEKWKTSIHHATQKALRAALDVALRTLPETRRPRSHDLLHQVAIGASGAIGGAFGLIALTVELPVSTTIILRSIMDIARAEGENLDAPETKLACLEVFALGGTSELDNATESGYFAARTALARTISEATSHLAKKGLTDIGAPALVRFITKIGARLEVVIAEKMAAQLIPILGAAGGGTTNLLFIQHFQAMARGHFVIRRLERKYGPEIVRRTYLESSGQKLPAPIKATSSPGGSP